MPEPFKIEVADTDLRDLKRRLAQTRWPSEVEGSGWQYGANLAYMKELCEYWQTSFDWRVQETYLNRMPQFTQTVSADGVEDYNVHFVHQQGVGPDPLPLVFTTAGRARSTRSARILPLQTDPASHGGDAADAFTVVAPSLPGYGFSEIPTSGGFGQKRTALLWGELMKQLGYERYGAQGGDWGAIVTAQSPISTRTTASARRSTCRSVARRKPIRRRGRTKNDRLQRGRSSGRRRRRATRRFRAPARRRSPMA